MFSEHSFLCTPMVVEILGRRQNTCSHDGPRHWYMLRNREETEEKVIIRLFVG